MLEERRKGVEGGALTYRGVGPRSVVHEGWSRAEHHKFKASLNWEKAESVYTSQHEHNKCLCLYQNKLKKGLEHTVRPKSEQAMAQGSVL